jgi:hypothetical protein
MKFILKPLLLILSAVAVIGCSKSKNVNPTPPEVSIVGKWYFSTDTVNDVSNGKITKSFINEGFTSAYFEQFNADGTGLSGDGVSAPFPFTYTISGNTVTTITSAYTLNGFTEPAITEAATIKVATATDLFLYYDDADEDGIAGDKVTEALHLKK